MKHDMQLYFTNPVNLLNPANPVKKGEKFCFPPFLRFSPDTPSSSHTSTTSRGITHLTF